MEKPKDYYLILGVARDASTAAIKRAYRRLAKKLPSGRWRPRRRRGLPGAAGRLRDAGGRRAPPRATTRALRSPSGTAASRWPGPSCAARPRATCGARSSPGSLSGEILLIRTRGRGGRRAAARRAARHDLPVLRGHRRLRVRLRPLRGRGQGRAPPPGAAAASRRACATAPSSRSPSTTPVVSDAPDRPHPPLSALHRPRIRRTVHGRDPHSSDRRRERAPCSSASSRESARLVLDVGRRDRRRPCAPAARCSSSATAARRPTPSTSRPSWWAASSSTGRGLPASPSPPTPRSLTAIGNDMGYDAVFRRQVEAHGRPGDVAIGISTSGRSPNVVDALRVARERGLVTVGLTGGGGGRCRARGPPDRRAPHRHAAHPGGPRAGRAPPLPDRRGGALPRLMSAKAVTTAEPARPRRASAPTRWPSARARWRLADFARPHAPGGTVAAFLDALPRHPRRARRCGALVARRPARARSRQADPLGPRRPRAQGAASRRCSST